MSSSRGRKPVTGGDDKSLTWLSVEPEPVGEAMCREFRLRRLANRHGCRAGRACPDPAAHARDLEDLASALEAFGVTPYRRQGARTSSGRLSRSKAS